MKNKIIEYHKKLENEYNTLLNDFNILFYGYGCKHAITKELFKTNPINCLLLTTEEICMEINKELFKTGTKNKELQIKHFELKYKTLKEKKTLILLNFDFKKLSFLAGCKLLKIVATIEKFEFCMDDFDAFNFVFRDLTTFIPYKLEIVGISLENKNSRYKSAESVFLNVTKKSKFIFIEMLKNKKNCTSLEELFELTKNQLLLKTKNECKKLLYEFIDHKIIKVNENENIYCYLNEDDANNFILKYKNI